MEYVLILIMALNSGSSTVVLPKRYPSAEACEKDGERMEYEIMKNAFATCPKPEPGVTIVFCASTRTPGSTDVTGASHICIGAQ
jgi:hypothetical protein